MMLAEIVRSCSHEKVAEAAMACIGACFLRQMRALAAAHGMSAGAYAAEAVSRFARDADCAKWGALASRIDRTDTPVLEGLRYILQTMVGEDGVVRDCAISGRLQPQQGSGVNA